MWGAEAERDQMAGQRSRSVLEGGPGHSALPLDDRFTGPEGTRQREVHVHQGVVVGVVVGGVHGAHTGPRS